VLKSGRIQPIAIVETSIAHQQEQEQVPMPYANGIHKAAANEALRFAQTLTHRQVETGMVIAAGLATDRTQAQRLPEPVQSDRPDADPDGEARDEAAESRSGRRRRRRPENGLGNLIDAAA